MILLKINLSSKSVIIKRTAITSPNTKIFPDNPSLNRTNIKDKKTSAVPKSFCKIINIRGTRIIVKVIILVFIGCILMLCVFRYFASASMVVNFANSEGWNL